MICLGFTQEMNLMKLIMQVSVIEKLCAIMINIRYTKLRMPISQPGQGILYMYSCVN